MSSRAVSLALGSLVVSLVVLAMKGGAWWLTGSVALLADALESVVNVATAVAALAAVQYASRPADANHPYGHAKVEYFSAVLEGALILVAAAMILHEAWGAFLAPRALLASAPGMAIAVLATGLNGAWAWHLGRRGRAIRSRA